MPKNLENDHGLSRGKSLLSSLVTRCIGLVEAVYVMCWGRQALERDGDWALPSNDRGDRGSISTLVEFRGAGPQI